MAACGSLQRFFEKPSPENSTLLEALAACKKIQPMKSIGLSNLIEIFGELDFKEELPQEFPLSSGSPPPPSSTSSSPISQSEIGEKPIIHGHSKSSSMDSLLGTCKSEYMGCPMHKDCFLSRNSQNLAPPFTEGLGFESSDEVADPENESSGEVGISRKASSSENLSGNLENGGFGGSVKISRGGGAFPPPISCIGKMGKPSIRFRSYRHDGRFVLREIKIPTLEIMRACREDGRLKLQLVHPDEEASEEEGEEEKEGEEEEEEEAEKLDGHEQLKDDNSVIGKGIS